jgi:hypothetical protein
MSQRPNTHASQTPPNARSPGGRAVEQRWSRREAVDVEAVIYHPDLGRVRGRCRNLCRDGAYVEMSVAGLEPKSLVDLVLGLRVGKQNILYRMRATVVHRGGAGAGFLFRDQDINFSRYLQKMLYAVSSDELALLEGHRHRSIPNH